MNRKATEVIDSLTVEDADKLGISTCIPNRCFRQNAQEKVAAISQVDPLK